MLEVLYDLTNQKFGRLTALEFEYNPKWKYAGWLCLCECGNKMFATSWQLRNGTIVSCGCYSRQQTGKRMLTHGITKTGKTHPLWKEYTAWQRARRRHGSTETFEDFMKSRRQHDAAEQSASNADTADTEE